MFLEPSFTKEVLTHDSMSIQIDDLLFHQLQIYNTII